MKLHRYINFISESTDERIQLRNEIIDDLLVELTDKFHCVTHNRKWYHTSRNGKKAENILRWAGEERIINISFDRNKNYTGLYIDFNELDRDTIIPIIDSIVQRCKGVGFNAKYRMIDTPAPRLRIDDICHTFLFLWIVIT